LVNSWHCFLNKTKLKCPQGGFNFPGEIKNTFCFAVFQISLELKSHHLIMGRGISPFPRNKKKRPTNHIYQNRSKNQEIFL